MDKALARELKKAERKKERDAQERARQEQKAKDKEQARAERNRQQAEIEKDIQAEINKNADKAIELYKERKKLGRPALVMTDSIKEEILNRLANGQPLTTICKKQGFPDPSTVYDEIRKNPDFAFKYARARESMTHTILYDTLQIADDDKQDAENNMKVQRDRLKIDTRFRFAGKVNPVYADKAPAMAIGEGASVTVNAVTVSGRDLSPDDRQKLRELLLAARSDHAKVIDG